MLRDRRAGPVDRALHAGVLICRQDNELRYDQFIDERQQARVLPHGRLRVDPGHVRRIECFTPLRE